MKRAAKDAAGAVASELASDAVGELASGAVGELASGAVDGAASDEARGAVGELASGAVDGEASEARALVRVTRRAAQDDGAVAASLTLPYAVRQKSRFRARLDDGREVGVALARGASLRHGDRLFAESAGVIEVRAADECVSIARSDDSHQLARACYHLGNRHVALQIDASELRYLHDHVLDEMVRALGLAVRVEEGAFEPEGGAYGSGHAHHGHHHA